MSVQEKESCMADRIRINTDRLGMDAGRIHDCIANLAKEIEGMKQSAAMLERMWEGAGKDAFHRSFMADIEAAQAAVSGLRDIYAYDTNAKNKYEQCERQIASMIADIKV